MAIDKITTPAIADDAVTNAKVSYNNNQFRNIIINGDMSLAQRGTSATGKTATGYYAGVFQVLLNILLLLQRTRKHP